MFLRPSWKTQSLSLRSNKSWNPSYKMASPLSTLEIQTRTRQHGNTFSPNCQILGDLRNNTLAWTSDPDHEEQVRSRQPHDLLDLIQGLKRANSEYQIEIIDCTCTNINEAAGYATVCVDAEGRGIPPGLVRRVAIWFEFRKMGKEKEWKCCIVETFPGMGT